MADIFMSAADWNYAPATASLAINIPAEGMSTTTPGHGFMVAIYTRAGGTVFDQGDSVDPTGSAGPNTRSAFHLMHEVFGPTHGHLGIYYKVATALEDIVTFNFDRVADAIWMMALMTHNYGQQHNVEMNTVGFGEASGVVATPNISVIDPTNWENNNTAFQLIIAGNGWPGGRGNSGDFGGNTGDGQNDDDLAQAMAMRLHDTWRANDRNLDPMADYVVAPIQMAEVADWLAVGMAYQIDPGPYSSPGDAGRKPEAVSIIHTGDEWRVHDVHGQQAILDGGGP